MSQRSLMAQIWYPLECSSRTLTKQNLTEKYLEGFSLFQLALEGFGRLCVISPLGINKVESNLI